MTDPQRKEAGREAERMGSGVKYPSRGCGGETPASRSEPTVSVEKAARWLADTNEADRPHPLIPFLRAEHGLSTAQAIAAIRKANEIRRTA